MASTFSAHEFVEIGVQIEKNGYAFYAEVLNKSKDARAREIFEYLKEEEKKHIDIFADILGSIHKYEPQGAYPEEYFLYMQALASNHIFTEKDKGREMALEVNGDMEALDKGIIFEKDSIVFYEGIKTVVSDEDQKIVDLLIDEEKKHLMKLVSLRKEMIAGG